MTSNPFARPGKPHLRVFNGAWGVYLATRGYGGMQSHPWWLQATGVTARWNVLQNRPGTRELMRWTDVTNRRHHAALVVPQGKAVELNPR